MRQFSYKQLLLLSDKNMLRHSTRDDCRIAINGNVELLIHNSFVFTISSASK